jgi:uncharacterized repeat protein (TIGR01451 family)
MFLTTTGYTQVDPDRVSVIAKLKYDSLASYKGGEPGLEACSIAVTGGSRLDLSTPACVAYRAFLESKVAELEDALNALIPEALLVHRLLVVFGGVSVILPKERVEELLELPGVVAIFDDGTAELETVASPQFIGADRLWEELGGSNRAGEGIIVGVIDSGVWPESPSFSDPDPSGNPYPPPPARWKGTACEFGSPDPDDVAFTCNNKLIGADRITPTLDALGLEPDDFLSARDYIGHGTHVLSTAAGNGGAEAAVVFGAPLAVISGVAPRAHAVAYKCGASGCAYSDIAAAVQQAVVDGVDVINYSASSPDVSPYLNPVGLSFLDAYEAGVVVSVSAGNSGPGADTITSPEPWAIAVGNSTHDNVMAGTLTVTASNGDTLYVAGVSITGSITEPRPIVVAESLGDEFTRCNQAPFPPDTFTRNEIVVCESGGSSTLKSSRLADAGASGLVMHNIAPGINFDSLRTDKHFLPAIHIRFAQKLELIEFLESHPDAVAVLEQGKATHVYDFPGGPPSLNLGTAPGVDVMNDGSSRGGPSQRLGVSKPDLTAPGTSILAGWVPTQSGPLVGAAGRYAFQQGTSMSAPHVAGGAALLLDRHPNWTPGQIKSALMTTAFQDLVKEDGTTPADPFDRGSGRIDLRRAFEPGLTFVGPSALDFLELKDNLWDLNYPSLYIPAHPGRFTVERTVANELAGQKQWKTQVSAPPDVEIVVPRHVTIPKDGTKTFEITIDAPNVPSGEVRHANLRLTHGQHEANFPISFVKDDFDLPLSKRCEPTTVGRGETTECTITASNTGTTEPVSVRIRDLLPPELRLKGGVDGATRLGPRELVFEGAIEGAQGPEVTVIDAVSPFGYLPLASLGIEPLDDDLVDDETIANIQVSPFRYGGETYNRIGFASNGFAIVGGGVVGLTPIPQNMPDPELPNNVIAPFWNDFCGDGSFYVATVDPNESGIKWLVLEWQDAVDCDEDVYSFQIWIQAETDQEAIFMVYGRVDGDGSDQFGFGVGAENKFGTSGETRTALPVVGRDLAVTTTPIIPGTHTITFIAKGVRVGDWENCAEMRSEIFAGTALACAEGEVRGGRHWKDYDDHDKHKEKRQ